MPRAPAPLDGIGAMEFWLNAQKACGLHRATRESGPLPEPLLHAS